jgi:hypothetical protein
MASGLFCEGDSCLNLAIVIEYTNLSAPEFRARRGVADCVLLCRVAGSVRLDTGTLITLPAALKLPNFDDYDARLHGIS